MSACQPAFGLLGVLQAEHAAMQSPSRFIEYTAWCKIDQKGLRMHAMQQQMSV